MHQPEAGAEHDAHEPDILLQTSFDTEATTVRRCRTMVASNDTDAAQCGGFPV